MQLEKNPILDLSAEQVTNIADRSTGMSLADLASIIELAIRNAIRTQNNAVTDKAFDEAFETISGGEQKHWDAEELESTARHEAGHALICWLSGEVPSYLTIIARGNHGGYMQHANAESKGTYSKTELLSKIRISMAGRAAELVYYGDEKGLTTGASSDIYHATRVAESLILSYGMDSEAGISYVDSRTLTGEYFDFVHKRVNAILQEELDKAVALIGEHRDAIDALVTALVEKNHLKGDEIEAILKAHIQR
jgi:ATP-dependent Zn protease